MIRMYYRNEEQSKTFASILNCGFVVYLVVALTQYVGWGWEVGGSSLYSVET